ncbi:MAG TPA: TonB-dependent receptor [Flavobacterium sp.]|jgi:hypothetical protein
MKPLLLLIILIMAPLSWSQEKQHRFSAGEIALPKLLQDIEQKFDVKYSYADTLVAPERVSIRPINYGLQQLHDLIAQQTKLRVLQISDRYYSVAFEPEDVAMTALLDEITVHGFLSKGIIKEDHRMVISPHKVRELPGVTDADILLSLQQLPGVKSPNETASGLHIRGGTPDQNLILWDGIRMYHPGHLFGMISCFNPNINQTINYYNKAADPKFGDRISSVIEIKPTDDIAEKLAVEAGINALDADVYVRTPIVKKKLGIQLAARKSLTEWIQTPTFTSLAEKVFQNTNFRDYNDENQLGFYDLTTKINFKPNLDHAISVTGIAIDNVLDFSTSDERHNLKTQHMNIRNFGSGVNWERQYQSGFKHHLLLHYSAYELDYERIQYQPLDSYDGFTKLNRITDSGAELNFSAELSPKSNLYFGYQLAGNDVSHSFTARSPGLIIELDQKHLFNVTHSGFINFKYKNESWDFHSGLRYNNFIHLKDYSFEPRIFIQRQLDDNFALQLTYEGKSQSASQVRETVANDLSLENYVWILSDGDAYPLQRANQYSTGIIYKNGSVVVDVDLYYKTLNGITSMTFGFLHDFDSAVRHGEGFTKGIDVLIQRNAPSWRIWLTYTYQDSQNRYENLNDGRYFPISSDTRHALSLSYFKKWGNYTLSAGWFLHSGRPYSILNEANQILSFNDRRLPVYHRLNISGAYQFYNGKSCKAKVGFSIFNAYNQRTLISKEYERQFGDIGDFAAPEYVAQNYYSMGVTPNIFARVNF